MTDFHPFPNYRCSSLNSKYEVKLSYSRCFNKSSQKKSIENMVSNGIFPTRKEHKSQYLRNKKYPLEISISAPFRSNTSEIHPSLPWASEVPKFKHAVMPRVLAFENSKAGTKCTAADASIKARLNWPKFLRLGLVGSLVGCCDPPTGIQVIKGANNFGTTPPNKNGKKHTTPRS